WSKYFPTKKFEFVTEVSPLGTGGAVKNVFDLDPGLKEAWIINGDTILEHPLPPLLPSTHNVIYTVLDKKNVFDAKPNLVIEGNRVVGIDNERGTVFDGGQVFINREAVEKYVGSLPVSFHELVGDSLKESRVGLKRSEGTCFDIGTPE